MARRVFGDRARAPRGIEARARESQANEAAVSPKRFPFRFWAALLAVTAFAAALRFYKLAEWSYWSDEAFTISDANSFYLDHSGRRPEHGLSFRIYGLWFQWAKSLQIPFDEFVARFLPAVFGAAGVFFTGALGARAGGRWAAIFAALLLAISPFHLYWSQNARSYALEVSLAIPAGLVLGSALLTARAWEFLLGAVLLTGAAFAHPSALTIVPGLLLFGIVGRTFGAERAIRMPWKWILLGSGAVAAIVTLSPLGRSIWVHFQVKAGASPALFLTTTAYYFRPALLACAALLAINGIIRKDRKSLFFTFLSFGTLAFGFAASCVVRANSQYVIAALPFFALLIGREIVYLAWLPVRGARVSALALAAVLIADFTGGAFMYFGPENGHRAKWREACNYVFDRKMNDDVIAATQAPIVECYLNPSNPLPRTTQASIYLGPFEPYKFETVVRLSRRAWFLVLEVDLDEWKRPDRARFEAFLRERCRAVAEWPLQFGGKDQSLRIWRYDP
ncbi:MAG: hypothetical protein ACKVS6_01600 [Planctomycetota bacterium]